MIPCDVEAKGVHKVFTRSILASGPRRVAALRGVDFAVPRGAVYGLVGESGSGKSTLARILVGIDRPSAGAALIEGRDPARESRRSVERLRRKAQMVFQDPSGALDPLMSVSSSLSEALASAGVPRAERAERGAELLRSVRLDPALAARRPRELSGGQRQRVVIARALACGPRFIALDEPVSSLDLSVQAEIIDLLLDIRERDGLGYLLVSHDLDLVGAVCERAAVMRDGVIVEEGDARALAAAPRHPFTIMLYERSLRLGARDRASGLSAAGGTERGSATAPAEPSPEAATAVPGASR